MRFKSLLLIGLMATGLSVFNSTAQNSPPPDLLDPKTALNGASVKQLESDGKAYYNDHPGMFNFKEATFEAGVAYNKGNFGAIADVQVPVNLAGSTNGSPLSIGFGVAYLNHQFYDGSLSARLGKTWDLKSAGKAYTYVESGPALNLKDPSTPLAQSFAGITWIAPVKSDRWRFTLGAAVGNITSVPGAIYVVGGSVTYKWGALAL